MNACKLCGVGTDFSDSHVIPKFFFKALRDGTTPPMRVTDRAGVLPQRAPIGEYDKTILCKECEPKFSEWDDYGKTVLVDLIKSAEPIHEGGELIAYRLRGINIPKLRMFFISVLWRASVSSREFYGKINLGPFEDRAKALILARSPGSPSDFAVILSKWDADWFPITSNPYMMKMDGVNAAVLEMMDYKVYIKVDNRDFPAGMTDFSLGAYADVCVFSRSFADSKERRMILGLAPKFFK